MRILHVIQELGTGGAEQVLLSTYRGARAAGHDVFVAGAPGPLAAQLEAVPLPVPLVQRRPWRIPAAANAVRRAVRQTRPDLVHVHNPAMRPSRPVSPRPRPCAGLVSVHGVPEEDWPGTVRLLRASGLPAVACGPGVAAALEQHGLSPLTTVVNAVGPAPAAADRSELEHEPGTRLMLAVGRLAEQKNHALAIVALRQVPNATLAIAGEGPLRAQLERPATETGVADRVRFPRIRTDARALMGAADVVVMPSRWEGLPLSALEALASGTPLVATDVRGLRELVVDGRDALLVPEDPDALAAALRRVLDDPELARRLGDAGRQVEGAGSDERLVAQYLELYERLAA